MTILRSHAPDEAAFTALELQALIEIEVWNTPRREVSRLEAERRRWLGLEPESELVDAEFGDFVPADDSFRGYPSAA